MAKLAINILIDNRKKIDRDKKAYSIISLLIHILLIVSLFFYASYSRYKRTKKPYVYRVALVTLPSTSSGIGKEQKVTLNSSKHKNITPSKQKKATSTKKKEIKGINTGTKKEKKEKNKKTNPVRGKRKGKNTSNNSNTQKIGFSSPASSIMDLDTTGFEYSYYLAIIRDRIGNNWVRTYTGTGKVKVYFKVMKNGEIRDARVEISSGNPGLDRLAIEAVLKSNPLPPLPENFKENYIGIHIWFNYEE